MCDRYLSKDEMNHCIKSDSNYIPIHDTEINFNEVRTKAAIAAMQGMLAHSARMYIGNETDWHEAIAKESVKLADSLILQLKKPINEKY